MNFNRVCYRHRTPFDRWEPAGRNAKMCEHPVCGECESKHGGTVPVWWILGDSVELGWGHTDYGGYLYGEPIAPQRLESLPLGLGCRFRSGVTGSVWRRSGTAVEVLVRGYAQQFHGGVLVEPLAQWSPHKHYVRRHAA